ncbi:LysR family transcriptional regulator [Pseudonocardia alni]|uniref:LysR substrate-binding domain-containing protein n=1 Tax=Pseudonocardia alni TaxID=33907 RepID=UPI00280A5E3C|nr:LysR family transcriptional regulator [Pseudonocardia alni]
MELRTLRYLAAVAQEGSVSAAARHLQVSQPTLSRQLRDLERRLGTVLFVRSGRRLVPTPPGEVLVQRAIRLLADAEAALDEVRLASEGRKGHLTVGFAGSGINGPLGAALKRLRTELPDVSLSLVDFFDNADMTAGLLNGRLDVAVQRLPVRDARIETRLWTREPLTLFLPESHALARTDAPAPVSLLGEIPLVIWPREQAPLAHDEIIALCHRAGVVPRIGARGHTVQTLLALVAAEFGAAVMTDSYRVLHREGVRTRQLTGVSTSLHLAWRSKDDGVILRRFLDSLGVSPSSQPRELPT